MKLVASISSIAQFNLLKDNLDGIVIGHNDYATTIINEITLKDLKSIIEETLLLNKEVILKIDIMPTNSDLRNVIQFVKDLKYPLTYLIQDLGLFQELKDLGYQNIIYSTSTLLTNYEDLIFYLKQGFKACMPSLEIPLKDVITMQLKAKKGIFFKAFGYHQMMHSKRKLISTYQEHLDIANKINNENSYLIEEIRDGKYPIIENEHGTIIFRPYPVSYLARIEEIKDFDYLFLDNLFIKEDIYVELVKIYNKVLKEEMLLEVAIELLNNLNIKYENAFIDLDTVYLKEEFQ